MRELSKITSNLRLRVAPLEWACDAVSRDKKGLNWVDSTIDRSRSPFQITIGEKRKQYRHRSYSAFLPKAMSRAAMEAQNNSEPTVLEGILLVFSRVEWLIAARPYFWSPMSPLKEILAILAESYGVGPELHKNDHETLSRLVARLPTWFPHRGSVVRARQLIEDTIGQPLGIKLKHVDQEGAQPVSLQDEVFICHSDDWWYRRIRGSLETKMADIHTIKKLGDAVPKATLDKAGVQESSDTEDDHKKSLYFSGELRIEDGLLRFQSEERTDLLKEDILVEWKPGVSFTIELLRLFPIWSTLRISAEKSKDKQHLNEDSLNESE